MKDFEELGVLQCSLDVFITKVIIFDVTLYVANEVNIPVQLTRLIIILFTNIYTHIHIYVHTTQPGY